MICLYVTVCANILNYIIFVLVDRIVMEFAKRHVMCGDIFGTTGRL